jgi:hypothetical protein
VHVSEREKERETGITGRKEEARWRSGGAFWEARSGIEMPAAPVRRTLLFRFRPVQRPPPLTLIYAVLKIGKIGSFKN